MKIRTALTGLLMLGAGAGMEAATPPTRQAAPSPATAPKPGQWMVAPQPVAQGAATLREGYKPIATSQPADKPEGRTAGSWMRQHQRYVDKAKAGNIDLYMLGDSITDFWGNADSNPKRAGDFDNWQKNFSGWKAGDFGVSGDLTQHCLWRIQNGELDGVKPKVIVLMIGTNNLPQTSGYTPEETAKGVRAILDTLVKKQPQAKILLLGIFPRQDYDRTLNVSIMDKIDATNALLAKYNDGKQIKYMNINAKFMGPDGKMLPEITFDWLHPNPTGYQIWFDAIRPQLVEWLGPPALSPATTAAAPAAKG